jgi:VIT family
MLGRHATDNQGPRFRGSLPQWHRTCSAGRDVTWPRQLLDPIERTSEVLFGLIMVLTFTGTISVAESGNGEIRGVLVGALGCNLAWGIVDAAMYLMAVLTQRARGILTLNAIRQARDPAAAHRIIGEALPEGLAALLGTPEFEGLRLKVNSLTDIPPRARFDRDDFIAAAGVFLIVFLSTLPVVVPFLVMREAGPALRASHAIAISMLFFAGWSLGRHAGRPGWAIGLAMVVLGLVLAGLTIALGG